LRLWGVGLLLLILVGFAVRIHHIDAQSLWGDEGWAVYHASQGSVPRVIAEAYYTGNHPPLYFLNLFLWMEAAGRSEFALRYLSLLFGVVTVPVMAVLGRRLGGRGVGVLAGLFQAIGPYPVYYSQEARMYPQAICFVVLAAYFFWRLSAAQETRTFLMGTGYVLSTALAGYSHVFAWPVLVGQGVFLLVDLVWRRSGAWRSVARGLVSQLAALGLFLPWLLYVFDRALGVSTQVEAMGVPLATIVRRCLSDFSATIPVIATQPTDLAPWALSVFLCAAALALLWPWRRRALLFMLACAAAPVLVIYAISFPTLPGWTRYFFAASPFYYLLLARGADGLGRWVARTAAGQSGRWRRVALTTLICAPLLLIQVRSLHAYFTEPAFQRWNYRGQIDRVVQDARAGAAVVLQGKSVMFEYYFPTAEPHYTVPSVCDLDEERVRREIAEIAATHDAVWVVGERSGACDPNQRAPQWLKEHAYQVSESWLESTIFDLYLTPAVVAIRPFTAPVAFDTQFELLGYGLSSDEVTAGEAVAIALQWRALHVLDLDYKLFLVVVGSDDAVYGLRDGMPQNWLWPTSRWKPGSIIDDRWGLEIDPDTPPGVYPLFVGAYNPATGVRLPIVDSRGQAAGDRLRLTEITVR